MNKKLLLSSLLASGIVATSLLTGSAKAATNVQNYGEKLISTVEKSEDNNYTMFILLPSSNKLNEVNNQLTKSKVVDLLEEKYKKGIVKEIYKEDGKTIVPAYQDKVGTGYIVELSTGRKLNIVLYGDITGDGIVDTNDTVAIAKNNVGTDKLTGNYAKAAKLTDDSKDIDTNDTVRVAYYNVNGLGTEKTGEAIIDIALYPEDYTDTEETVTSDVVLQDAIDKILSKENNKKLFDITLDGETNTAKFGLLNSKDKISNFVDTDLIDTLVDQLKNNDNLTKIELSVEGLTEPIVLDKNSDESACLLAAKNLIAKLLNKSDDELNNLLDETVDKLFGKEMKARFYVADTSILIDDNIENNKELGKTNVEYTLKFVGKVNVDKTMDNILEKINNNQTSKNLFKIKFNPETNIGEFGFLDNTSKITDFVQTGLVEELAEQLTDPNIKKMELSILKAGNDSVYEKQEIAYNSNKSANIKGVTEAAIKLLKSALGIDNAADTARVSSEVQNKVLEAFKDKTVLDLAGKTLDVKIYLGDNTEVYDNNVINEDNNKYLKYSLNFLVDATSQIEKNIFNVLNTHSGNDIYRVEFDENDKQLINFNISKGKKDTALSAIKGQGHTGLIEMATKLLSADSKSDIQNITVKFSGKDYVIRKTTGNSVQFENTEIQKLFNAIFGKPEENQVNDNVLNEKLSKLEGVELEIKLGLSEKAVKESNWNSEEIFKVKFNFVDSIPTPSKQS